MVPLSTCTSPRFRRQGKGDQEKSSDLLMAAELAGGEKLSKTIQTRNWMVSNTSCCSQISNIQMCYLQHPQFPRLFVMQRIEEYIGLLVWLLAEVKHQYRQAQCFSAPREPHRGTCCCCVHGGRGSVLPGLILAFLFTGYLPWAIALPVLQLFPTHLS